MAQGPFAFRAVHHIVISAPGPALEEYATFLVKLCRPRGLRQLLMQLVNHLTLLIYLLLGLREFLFSHRTPRSFESNVIPRRAVAGEAARPGDDGNEHSDASREDPRPEVGGGFAQVGHAHQPSTWEWPGPRWRARADLILALLGLVVLPPFVVSVLLIGAARAIARMVVGR